VEKYIDSHLFHLAAIGGVHSNTVYRRLIKAVDAPLTPKKKEKLSRSQKIVQVHNHRYKQELAACKDPSLAVLLKAMFEENVYQQNVNDIVKLFQEPLIQDPNLSSKVSKNEVEGMFSNIKDIQRVHLEIHASYRECQENFPRTSVCKTLQKAVSFLLSLLCFHFLIHDLHRLNSLMSMFRS